MLVFWIFWNYTMMNTQSIIIIIITIISSKYVINNLIAQSISSHTHFMKQFLWWKKCHKDVLVCFKRAIWHFCWEGALATTVSFPNVPFCLLSLNNNEWRWRLRCSYNIQIVSVTAKDTQMFFVMGLLNSHQEVTNPLEKSISNS